MKLYKILKDGTCEADVYYESETLEKILETYRCMYKAVGYEEPWVAYVAFHGYDVAGTCAFRSRPQQGSVEIAYYTFPPYQGRGIGSRMVTALMEIARGEDPSIIIVVRVVGGDTPANSILKKFGFKLVTTETASDGEAEIWEWHLLPENDLQLN